MKTLVPRVIGQTAAASHKKPGEVWTLPRFRERLREKKGEAAVAVSDRILEWARGRMPDLWFGRGTADGSIVPRLWINGQRYLFFSLYSSGVVELSPQWMKAMPGFEPDERRREFLERINRIAGVSVPVDAISRRPSFPILLLAEEDARRTFFDVMEWAISTARESAERAPDHAEAGSLPVDREV
jgi:hypothetical protein